MDELNQTPAEETPAVAAAPTRRSANAAASPTNTISITLRPLFGDVKTVVVPRDCTVETLLAQSGFSASAEVRAIGANGNVEQLTPDAILEDGDTVSIVSAKKITNG